MARFLHEYLIENIFKKPSSRKHLSGGYKMAKDQSSKITSPQKEVKAPIHLEEKKAQVKADFLKVQNECYLCGYSLDTYVEYVPLSHSAIEKAKCHNCMTLVRVKNHSIQ